LELDTKQKVLLAIYTEYQKDYPDMTNITFENLGLDQDVFNFALAKLSNEELINDVIFSKTMGNRPPMALINNAKMSRLGIEYVETMLNINKTAGGIEKANVVRDAFEKQGFSILTDFAAKVIAEMLKTKL